MIRVFNKIQNHTTVHISHSVQNRGGIYTQEITEESDETLSHWVVILKTEKKKKLQTNLKMTKERQEIWNLGFELSPHRKP